MPLALAFIAAYGMMYFYNKNKGKEALAVSLLP
jgi:hypothetical protein